MKFRTLSLMFLVFPILVMAAQDFRADFVQGKAEWQASSTGAWSALETGRALDSRAIVRLAEGARVDLRGSKGTVILNRAGTWAVKDLSARADAAAKVGTASMMGQKLKTLATPAAGNLSAGGVRAKIAEDRVAGSDPRDLLREGARLLMNGESRQALSMLEEAFTSQADDDAAYYYYYALALHDTGKSPEALDILASLPDDAGTSMDFEGGSVDMVAEIQVLECLIQVALQDPEGLDAAAAKALSGGRLDLRSRQEILMLRALSALWKADNRTWKSALEEAVALDPASSQGKSAAALLKGK